MRDDESYYEVETLFERPADAPPPGTASGKTVKIDPDVPVGPDGRAIFKLTCTAKVACTGGLAYTFAGVNGYVRLQLAAGLTKRFSVPAAYGLKQLKGESKATRDAWAKGSPGSYEGYRDLNAVHRSTDEFHAKRGFTKLKPRLLRTGENVDDAEPLTA